MKKENGKKQRRRLSKRTINILLAIGFALTAALACYPSFMNSFNNIHQTTEIGGYEDEAKKLVEPYLSEFKDDALAYNQKLFERQQRKKFYYAGYDGLDDLYEAELKISKYNRVMAYIDIPQIGVYLPIVHGCADQDLKQKIGHMYGTSLPIGGENSHCVLAGHTGLEEADLFTYITRLKVGDRFYIHVVDEIHVYTICDSHVVWPLEEAKYLQIEPGRDLVTLYTCTPYGVNDHRLLLAAERTYPDLKEPLPKGTAVTTTSVRKENIVKCIVIAMIPTIVLIIGLRKATRKKKKKHKKAAEKK